MQKKKREKKVHRRGSIPKAFSVSAYVWFTESQIQRTCWMENLSCAYADMIVIAKNKSVLCCEWMKCLLRPLMADSWANSPEELIRRQRNYSWSEPLEDVGSEKRQLLLTIQALKQLGLQNFIMGCFQALPLDTAEGHEVWSVLPNINHKRDVHTQ